jgi:hypothetical protein
MDLHVTNWIKFSRMLAVAATLYEADVAPCSDAAAPSSKTIRPAIENEADRGRALPFL